MARGQEILLTSPPKGNFEEGQITDTSKPGTCVEMVPGTGFTSTTAVPATLFQGGRATWRAVSRTAGAIGPVTVLLPDRLQGGLATTAYAANTQAFLYWPVAGDELNMLVGDVTGTGDIITAGDLYGVNNNGKLIKNSSYASAPFKAKESVAALTADTLIWFQYLGNAA